jgi:hypothetical protein
VERLLARSAFDEQVERGDGLDKEESMTSERTFASGSRGRCL